MSRIIRIHEDWLVSLIRESIKETERYDEDSFDITHLIPYLELLVKKAVEGYVWTKDFTNGETWLINPTTSKWLLRGDPHGVLWINLSLWLDYFKYVNLEDTKVIREYLENYFNNMTGQRSYFVFTNNRPYAGTINRLKASMKENDEHQPEIFR